MRPGPPHLPLALAAVALAAACGGRQPAPPPELPAAPPAEHPDEPTAVGVYHTVGQGQTLWRIARAYGVSVERVADANGLEDPTRIDVGQRLWIPGARSLVEVPPAKAPTAVAGSGDYAWPVRGKVSSRFGMRNGRPHTGVDITAPSGTPVRAARDGVVSYAGSRFRGYGNLVIIDHGDGFVTYYAHNRDNLVREGQQVERGQRIARVGRTGNATGPHLHFEIRRGNHLLDPMEYLDGRP